MANVIKTVLTYQLDGSKRDFNIPFEYLARKFVVVTLIGVDRKVLTINTDYRFATRTTISLTKAFGPADGYNVIELRRVTSTTDRLVDFTDGSILRAYDLNVAQIQTMHVAEEARDLTADTIGVNNDGHLDARGRKIVNLAFATGDYDAVPLKQIKERENSAWNAVIESEEHANRSNNEANRSRDEADRARREADRSTQQAGVSTAQAVESKTQADRSNSEANRAKGYADSMTASVAEAKNQADRSNSEANRARDEANRASGEVTKAAAEVAKAAAHVETAKGHADRANTEANRSKSEADRATNEANKLGNMNALAGAVSGVSPDHSVEWASNASFNGEISNKRSITLRSPATTNSMGQMVHEYDGTDGQYVSNTYWAIKHPHRGDWHIPYKVINMPNDSAAWEMHFVDLMRCFNGLRVEAYNKPLGVHNGANTGVNTITYGPGDLGQGTWVCNTRWSFYDAGLEIGWVRGGSANGNGLIRWKPESSQSTYHDIWLNPGGVVQFPEKILVGGTTIDTNGDINGSVWGGLLSSWLVNNTVNHIAMGGVNWAQLWRAGGVSDGGGKVITGIINSNGDELVDGCQWRVMQYVRNNGQRFNIY